jgi:hypothetical protein
VEAQFHEDLLNEIVNVSEPESDLKTRKWEDGLPCGYHRLFQFRYMLFKLYYPFKLAL